jgi:hypothetical protein
MLSKTNSKPFNKASANCVRQINHIRRENGTSTSALSMANVIVVITAAAFWLQEIFPPPILYILCLVTYSWIYSLYILEL